MIVKVTMILLKGRHSCTANSTRFEWTMECESLVNFSLSFSSLIRNYRCCQISPRSFSFLTSHKSMVYLIVRPECKGLHRKMSVKIIMNPAGIDAVDYPMSNVPRRRYFTSFSQHGIIQWELVQNSILCSFQYIVSGSACTYTLSKGIELSFTDSGVPPGSADYTTVVFLHGGIFNAYQFHKVHAHAHAQNLRTVLLHRRDYAGSTSYSATEIEELEQGSVSFWERLSAQVAQFLEIFIERERIPKLTRKLSSSRETTCSFTATSVKENRGGNGGIAIFAWSAGCSTALSFLGGTQNPLISKELYQLLQQYVGNCILYDPTYLCFGYPLPSDNRNYIPWDDPMVSTDELPQLVAEWVSSYYDHPCYDPVTRSLPSTATINELDGIRLKSDRISISSWTDEELVKGLEGSSAKNETLAFQPSVQKTLRQLSEQALFNETSVSNWFPGVGVSYIGGTRSNWMCAWAIIETKRRYLRTLFTGIEKNGRSYNIRKIRFVDMDGLNHVAHWDQTREFMEVIAKEIQLL